MSAMVSLETLAGLIRDLQSNLPAGDLAVVRVPRALLDRASFARHVASRLPGLDRGQMGDLRYPQPDGTSLHVHVFAAYIEAHIDATDPTRDPVAHVVEATQAVPGAAVGVGAAFFLGWPVAIVCATIGALVPRQRCRLFAVVLDAAGQLTVLPLALPPARRGVRRPLPMRRRWQ
jgi:hypothetical protein